MRSLLASFHATGSVHVGDSVQFRRPVDSESADRGRGSSGHQTDMSGLATC